VSAKGTGRGARTALGALLLAAGAAGALAACGHYGPPLRAAEYREAEEAEKAAEREQRRALDAESPAEAPTQDDEAGGNLTPDPGQPPPEGLEAP
jgi:hypothetical protein